MTAALEPKDAGLLSDLGRATRGLVLVARKRPLAIVGAIAAVALAPSCACLVGLLFVPAALVRVLAIARDELGRRPHPPTSFAVTHVPVLGFHALTWAGAMVAWVAATALLESLLARVAAMSAGAAVAGALHALVVGATWHALEGRRLADALEMGLGDTVRRGLVPRALAGAAISLVTVAVPLALVLLSPELVSGSQARFWALLAVPLGGGVGQVWMLALAAPPTGASTPTTPLAGPLITRVLALGAPVGVVVLFALAFAAARPSPGHAVPTRDERARSVDVDGAVALPGEHGLVVGVRSSGVSIDAADGGGAGLVELGAWPHGGGPEEVRVARSGAEGWIVFATDVERPNPLFGRDAGYAVETRGVRFDGRGVRTDDGLSDRVRWRFGTAGLWLLVLALLLATPFVVTVVRGIGGASVLERGEAAGDYIAWSGALEHDDGAFTSVEGGRLATVDGARLIRDGNDGVVSLAPGALILGPDGPLAAGTRVTMVARSNRLATLGPRTGAIAWPKDAWLVVGSLDAAKDRIVRASLRTAALFGVPSALAALVACVVSLLSS